MKQTIETKEKEILDLIEKNRAFKEQISEELDQKSEYARNLSSTHEKDLAL